MNRSAREAQHSAELAQKRAARAEIDEKIQAIEQKMLKVGLKESDRLKLKAEIKSLEAQKAQMRLKS